MRERLATYEFDTEAIAELQGLIATVAAAIIAEVPEPSRMVTGPVVCRIRP